MPPVRQNQSLAFGQKNMLGKIYTLHGHQPDRIFCCLHGELARLQPHSSHLTGYYLMLAIGGMVGGLFVGVIAPYGFHSNHELSVGILLTGLVAALAVISKTAFTRPLWRWVCIAFSAGVLLALAWIRIGDHLQETRGAEIISTQFLRYVESL